MHTNKNQWIILLGVLIIILSTTALLINYLIYQYPANNYFPPNVSYMLMILIFFYTGLIIYYGKNHRMSQSGRELLNFFGIMCLIALATNATQLTPFPPIDQHIIILESLVHINMEEIITWTHSHPWVYYILSIVYDSLNYQMCFLPLIVLVMGKFNLLRDYYFLLLFTTLLGFSFYYFYPTTAPASVIDSPFFSPYQLATGLKFNQIHHHIEPTTIEGGLIALPSFHCIWALLCVYLLKDWRIPCVFLLFINIILVCSCVLLGWHYPIDILAGIILVGLGYYYLKKLNNFPNDSCRSH